MAIEGRWAIVWPEAGWDKLDLPQVAFELTGMGFAGVSLHAGLDAAAEARVHVDQAHDRAGVFTSVGLKVAVGLGFPKPTPGDRIDVMRGIRAAIDGRFDHVQLDWEGSWDGHQADAQWVVDAVLQAFPEGIPCPVTSLCWWAPKVLPDGHGTHPSAPTEQFLRLTSHDVPVMPQCYNSGTHDGETAWQLAWSRKQYATLGFPAVAPTIQGYAHSIRDRVPLLLAEPTVNCWDWCEFDGNFRASLRVASAVAKHGFKTVTDYQRAVGLVPDGICGAKTMASLGLAIP